MDILQPALTRNHALSRDLLAQIPNIVIALVVFFIFYNISRLVRSGMRSFAQKQRKHLSLGLVLGRLAQGLIVFVGMLVALVIALPGFQPAQLIQLL
ncbi:MAG: mechanosensitive ion channel family protein, partial [Cytophagaceae bacterium]